MDQIITSGVPSSATCPTCKAAPGHPCRTRQDYSAATHKTRWKAVGSPKPTLEEWNQDWAVWQAYYKRRDEKNLQRVLVERAAADLATKSGLTPGSPEWRAAIRTTLGSEHPRLSE